MSRARAAWVVGPRSPTEGAQGPSGSCRRSRACPLTGCYNGEGPGRGATYLALEGSVWLGRDGAFSMEDL